MGSSLNIIVCGESGTGKSSVVNLIAGKEIAPTSVDAQRCTTSFKAYTLTSNHRNLRIWDAVGLGEPEMGSNVCPPAIEGAYDLIRHLANQGGVDLLLFCVAANRITGVTLRNYKFFYEALCRSRVPVVLVVTHLEREAHMERWWDRNVTSIVERFGIRAAGHACVTGLPTHGKYRESQRAIAELLDDYDGDGRFTMVPDVWLIEFLDQCVVLGFRFRTKVMSKIMTKRWGLDSKVAGKLAAKLERGR